MTEVVELKIDEIRPYWKNPRSDQPVDEVKASIERYGYQSPIVVDADNVIIAGHTRYKALRELGWSKVAVVRSDLPPEKAREYRIADNAIGEIGDWDWGSLTEELRAMEDLTALDGFFPDLDLDSLVDASVPGESEERTTTQDDIERAERDEKERVGGGGGHAMYEVLCPECGASFFVRPDLLERHEQIHEARGGAE